ncbi:DIS3-like exonuclease 2 [Physella acuta]|uniref:DIS3-like exonuclease 2 n=1 Tax=Physella acuta TaxID=109671 RepID=UPI0027DD2BD9|nr:DIS3-like exonuclease 2 [Physella acuta]
MFAKPKSLEFEHPSRRGSKAGYNNHSRRNISKTKQLLSCSLFLDGKREICIDGEYDRNRSFDGDRVIVQLYNYEKWRVFYEDFQNYERSLVEEHNLVTDEIDDYSGADAIVKSGGDEGTTLAMANVDTLGPQGVIEKFQDKSPQYSNKNKAQTIPSQGSSKGKPMKKISSVSDTITNGSPLAKQLFRINPYSSEAPDSQLCLRFIQRTGKVVFIKEKKHSRTATGRLTLMLNKLKKFALFTPTDIRIPRILIPITLVRSLGEAGEIDPETSALLIELDIDDSPFSDKVIQCLPTNSTWTIPDLEYSYRKDLRRSCIFTIDPATARDLDDALSIEELGGGKFQVGVHIADVSYFVKEDTELDMVASRRATSVYLVQKVVPMLPRLLCEQLCSLNPDEERLTFSVIWTLNEKGEIFDEWYGRSVIRSCVKLSYEHAQGFIEDPEIQWRHDELPTITNSFTASDIVTKVILLNKIAVNLRQKRFDKGALELDQVKVQFALNKISGLPNGYSVYEQKDSHRLIEEFMLLANMSVADRIKKSFQDTAILRRQPPPQVKSLDEIKKVCESFGLRIETATSGDIQKSLQHLKEDGVPHPMMQVLAVMLSKSMQKADYFCCSAIPESSLQHHYSLNVERFTHFTSPIRRYPDILVHRLLAAALGREPPTRSIQDLRRQAEHCNVKSHAAQVASKRSDEIFSYLFIKAGPLEESGMVMAVLDKSFDVLVLKLGVVKRVYLERLPLASSQYHKNSKCPELLLEWKPDESCHRSTRHKITLFSIVECCLASDKEPLKWSCIIKRPKDEITYMDAGHD